MSKVIRVAVIGTGFARRVQIPGFHKHPRFDVVAVAARDEARTREVAQMFNLSRWYTDWREMLRDGGFDLVSITPPPHLHHEMTLAALEAGFHVLCEKPIAMNSQQAREMVARANVSDRTVMINHEFRYLAARHRFGELVKEGYIGGLRRLVIQLHTSGRNSPDRPWNWWSDADQGGGMLGAMGSHSFDAFRTWFGLQPRRVFGRLNTFVPMRPLPNGEGRRRVTSDDSFVAFVELEEKAELLFDFTGAAAVGPGSTITAIGNEGTLVIEDDARLLGARGEETLRALEVTPLPREEGEPWLLAPFLRLLDDLAAGIDKGRSPSPNLLDGLAHQLFIDAVRLSHERGEWIDFPVTMP